MDWQISEDTVPSSLITEADARSMVGRPPASGAWQDGDPIGERRFASFGELTMRDSNQFHATCLDTFPPIFYLNETSKAVIHLVHAYNKWKGRTAAAYTFTTRKS